jgi:hypothetical protein
VIPWKVRWSALLCVAGMACLAHAQPKMVLEPAAWDFGEAWHGELPETTLHIKNVGTELLKLSRIHAC